MPAAALRNRLVEQIVVGQSFQPGVLVRCENRVRFAGERQDFSTVEDDLVLEQLEANPGPAERTRNPGIPMFALRFVIAVGKHCSDAEGAGQARDFFGGAALANDQATTMLAQHGVEFDQRLANERNAAIGAFAQGIEYLAIEDERAVHPTRPGAAPRRGRRGRRRANRGETTRERSRAIDFL